MLLRKIQSQNGGEVRGSKAVDFNDFIDRFTSSAVSSDVYVLQKIVGHRQIDTGADKVREYKVRWKYTMNTSKYVLRHHEADLSHDSHRPRSNTTRSVTSR